MYHLQVAEAFGRLAAACGSFVELRRLLDDAIREIGWHWYALVFGVGYGSPLKDWLWLYNYPAAWEEIFFGRGYYVRDPILGASERTSLPFIWAEARHLFPPGHDNAEIMEAAARMGLVHGFTCPFNQVREPSGCCNFAHRCHRDMSSSERQCLMSIGHAAIQAVRRLKGYPDAALPMPNIPPHLHACIELIANGMDDNAIAQHLNIAPATACTYGKRVRRLLNVTSRAQVGPEALRFGLIGMSDIRFPGPAPDYDD